MKKWRQVNFFWGGREWVTGQSEKIVERPPRGLIPIKQGQHLSPRKLENMYITSRLWAPYSHGRIHKSLESC